MDVTHKSQHVAWGEVDADPLVGFGTDVKASISFQDEPHLIVLVQVSAAKRRRKIQES